jgi:hypothetical protein
MTITYSRAALAEGTLSAPFADGGIFAGLLFV